MTSSPPKLLTDKAPVGVQKYPPAKFALESMSQRKGAGIFPAFLGEFGAEIMQWLKTPQLKKQDMERKRMGISSAQMLGELDELLQRMFNTVTAYLDRHWKSVQRERCSQRGERPKEDYANTG